MQSGRTDQVDLGPGFASFKEGLCGERDERIELSGKGISFGVAFLDDALGGIYPNDLIVVGAKPGFGKSQLVSLIAQSNAKQKRRVHFFALEAERREIERRVKYQVLADKFFSAQVRPPVRLNYMDWYYGKLDQHIAHLEREIDGEIGELYSTLNVFYRTSGQFTEQDFMRRFFAIKDETDLAIVDHLHYFDYEDDNENRAVKSIVKTTRDCALIASKPIILVSHVRKIDRRMKQLIPEIEDFHGSSDIGKIATKAITIAPDPNPQKGTQRKTYFSILKCRADGSRTRAVALLGFNLSKQRYEDEYHVGSLSADGTEFIPFEGDDVPFWAKRAINAKKSEVKPWL
jgi:replicative DNA helicase